MHPSEFLLHVFRRRRQPKRFPSEACGPQQLVDIRGRCNPSYSHHGVSMVGLHKHSGHWDLPAMVDEDQKMVPRFQSAEECSIR